MLLFFSGHYTYRGNRLIHRCWTVCIPVLVPEQRQVIMMNCIKESATERGEGGGIGKVNSVNLIGKMENICK